MYSIVNDLWDTEAIKVESILYGLTARQVEEIIKARGKIALIRAIRANTGLGIREGKAVVDSWILS